MKKEYTVLSLILLASLFLRGWISNFKVILIDYDAFYHARIAQEIYNTHHIPVWDSQELGGIPHYYPPIYHILITLCKYVLPKADPLLLGSLLTVYLGIIATIIVYCLGRTLSRNIGLLSTCLFAFTPVILLRSGLWARPTGLSIFFAALTIYIFSRLKANKDPNWTVIGIIICTGYIFSHSSVIIVLLLVLIASLVRSEKEYIKKITEIILVCIVVAGIYYFRFIPSLNFSTGYTSEYSPLFSPLKDVYTADLWWTLSVLIFYFSIFNLTNFPVILHGVYTLAKNNLYLSILTLLSLMLIFFRANLFVLFLFSISIAFAHSISNIYKMGSRKIGILLAGLIFISTLSLNIFMINELHGVKTDIYVDIVRDTLIDSSLPRGSVVLSNNPNVGHAIAYYTDASTFLSDLTDTKQWSKNKDLFNILMNENISVERAIKIMKDNNIEYLLIVNSSREKIFPFLKDIKLEKIKENKKDQMSVTIYRIKKEKEEL
jgi:4-amino-4-deoxy-L-arabinose transferase-like glycosyltransferase